VNTDPGVYSQRFIILVTYEWAS